MTEKLRNEDADIEVVNVEVEEERKVSMKNFVTKNGKKLALGAGALVTGFVTGLVLGKHKSGGNDGVYELDKSEFTYETDEDVEKDENEF